MRQFLLGPGEKRLALALEEQPQLVGPHPLDEAGLLLAADLQVDQRQFDFLQLPFGAEQPAVDPGLGPVQVPVVGRLQGEVTAVGLDFLQAVRLRIVAIRPAAHLQVAVASAQRHLALVVSGAPGGHQGMSGDAFQGAGRRGEAQVEVAALGGELAKRAHRHLVQRLAALLSHRHASARSRPPPASPARGRTAASVTGCPAGGRPVP